MAAVGAGKGRSIVGRVIGRSSPNWVRLGATAVAAIVVAEGAAWLLRPREVIEPVAGEREHLFHADSCERAPTTAPASAC